jgi:hypothetical protein
VLRSLRAVTQGNLIIVLGCGGDRDRAKRPMMGAAAASLADVAILTSDNPRSEDPLAILAAMLDGVLSVPQDERARVIIEPDRAAAISQAVALATPGDVIVVAGKGHETGQYIAGAVLPFEDRQVTAAALAQREHDQREHDQREHDQREHDQRERDQRGQDQLGPGPLGPDRLGPGPLGPDQLGPGPLEPGRLGPGPLTSELDPWAVNR